jgi:branched-chain amino acid aminotransferase
MENLKIIKTQQPKIKNLTDLGFGKIFTDHMFVMDYTEDKGWHDPRIVPYGSLSVDPSASVLHYGQGVFEGLKAYRNKEGEIQLFRPEANFARLNRSAEKLCIPQFDEELALKYLKALLKMEKDWVPSEPETSLYIRPYIIATEAFLGVNPSQNYKFIIILSPVGAYYPEGFKPVKIMVEEKYVRAVRGGLGEAKTMANYAASLLAGEEANKKGFSQVLWLDGINQKYVEEVGTMNIFFKIDGEVITPPLLGSILPGITRDSVIKILKSWNIPVKEERISIDEVFQAYKNGKLEEVFGTGTAAVISPVSELVYKGETALVDNYDDESLVTKLYNYLLGIQYGTEEDQFNWVQKL